MSVPLQCQQICLYVKTEFPYCSVFTMISAMGFVITIDVGASYIHIVGIHSKNKYVGTYFQPHFIRKSIDVLTEMPDI